MGHFFKQLNILQQICKQTSLTELRNVLLSIAVVPIRKELKWHIFFHHFYAPSPPTVFKISDHETLTQRP